MTRVTAIGPGSCQSLEYDRDRADAWRARWLAVRGDPRRVSADEISGVEREMDRWKT